MITEKEKYIYNKYLATSRSRQGKPFKLRKKFDDFSDENFVYIKKLNLFFNKFQHVSMDDFFIAPYEVYPDNTGFDLKFYTTQRALKVYTLYTKRKAYTNPDSEEQLFDIKRSLQYILKFCNRYRINIEQYTDHRSGNMFSFVLHLREHKINIYTMFGFEKFESNLNSYNREELEFTIGDYIDNLDRFRTNFISSNRAKTLVHEGLKKIKQIQNEKTVEIINK